MEIADELAGLENLLRELVLIELHYPKDDDWSTTHGVAEKTVERWRTYRDREERRPGGALGPSLLHYASLGELRDLIVQRWGLFASVFSSHEDFNYSLRKLMDLRDPDAHRRSLLTWQRHLVMGLAGEIRTQIVKFRSSRLNHLDYKPRFILAYDDEGYYAVPEDKKNNSLKRSGETIRLTVKAEDPLDCPIEYRFFVYGVGGTPFETRSEWSSLQTEFSFELTDCHITNRFEMGAECRRISPNEEKDKYDDLVIFTYVVLPSVRFIEGLKTNA